MTLDTSMAPLVPGARNVALEDLAALLRDQQARKADIVLPAAAVRAHGARLVVEQAEPVLGPDGVTMTSGTYAPTEVCDQGIADKLGIPAAYLRKLREQKPGLYDANVNGWLDGDDRRFLADTALLPNVSIRIVPFRAGLHRGALTGPFVILRFPLNSDGQDSEPPVAYVNGFTGALYLESPARSTATTTPTPTSRALPWTNPTPGSSPEAYGTINSAWLSLSRSVTSSIVGAIQCGQ